MRLATVTDLDKIDGLGNYKLRDKVVAVPCEDGATVTDAAGAGIRSFPGPCYLIVNPAPDAGFDSSGDRFSLVAADVFDALFGFESAVEPTKAEPSDGDTATHLPHVVHNDDGSVTIDGVTYNQAAAQQ